MCNSAYSSSFNYLLFIFDIPDLLQKASCSAYWPFSYIVVATLQTRDSIAISYPQHQSLPVKSQVKIWFPGSYSFTAFSPWSVIYFPSLVVLHIWTCNLHCGAKTMSEKDPEEFILPYIPLQLVIQALHTQLLHPWSSHIHSDERCDFPGCSCLKLLTHSLAKPWMVLFC